MIVQALLPLKEQSTMRRHKRPGPHQVLSLAILLSASAAAADDDPRAVDYLNFANGALPVRVGGMAAELKVDLDMALRAIDGDGSGFVVTPKPGAADTGIWFVYRLPAATTFTDFSVPEVRETPSPSQSFFREVEIAGGVEGPDGAFELLARATLSTHAANGQVTRFPATTTKPVNWVKLTLRGGIDVQRDKTFFEFSEIVGGGSQEPVPMLEAFTGKWKGRGVKLELTQEGANVSGCYDGVGDLSGTVSGNLLRATGADRVTGVPSSFVLGIADDGSVIGVRSTNRAPFHLYIGAADAQLVTECSERATRTPGCGSIVHGIGFDYDSAVIRPDSAPVLDSLYAGLKEASEAAITIVGHTSSEGAEAYNRELSQRRAAAVVAALVARGIDGRRLSAHGAGEAEPIADNDTEAGRSLNRRVEVTCR